MAANIYAAIGGEYEGIGRWKSLYRFPRGHLLFTCSGTFAVGCIT